MGESSYGNLGPGREQRTIALPEIGEVGSIIVEPTPDGALAARGVRADEDVLLTLVPASGC